jgi:hypothetical protein
VDYAAGGCEGAEDDLGAGEGGAVEDDLGAGELGAVEVDLAAGERGATEADRAARELGAAEVTTVKDHAREVEIQALPGDRSVVYQVRGDDPDDSVADFAAGLEGKPLRFGSLF